MRTHKYKEGFTLIELLVVISIIGMLSTIILASLTSARKKANIAQSIESVHSLSNALEIYQAQINRVPNWNNPTNDPATNILFPSVNNSDYDDPAYSADGCITDNCFNQVLKPVVTNGFISSIPNFPYKLTDWGASSGVLYTYISYPSSDSVPNREYWTCGDTKWGNWTIVITDWKNYSLANDFTNNNKTWGATPDYDFTGLGRAKYYAYDTTSHTWIQDGYNPYAYGFEWCITGS